MVDLYYLGYHLIPEEKLLIIEIKNRWNNFRLSTYNFNKQNTLGEAVNSLSKDKLSFENRLKNLFLIPSPYEIKNGLRFIRGTNKLVSESLKIIAIDNLNNRFIFSSIIECSIALKLDRINFIIWKNNKKKFFLLFPGANLVLNRSIW